MSKVNNLYQTVHLRLLRGRKHCDNGQKVYDKMEPVGLRAAHYITVKYVFFSAISSYSVFHGTNHNIPFFCHLIRVYKLEIIFLPDYH